MAKKKVWVGKTLDLLDPQTEMKIESTHTTIEDCTYRFCAQLQDLNGVLDPVPLDRDTVSRYKREPVGKQVMEERVGRQNSAREAILLTSYQHPLEIWWSCRFPHFLTKITQPPLKGCVQVFRDAPAK